MANIATVNQTLFGLSFKTINGQFTFTIKSKIILTSFSGIKSAVCPPCCKPLSKQLPDIMGIVPSSAVATDPKIEVLLIFFAILGCNTHFKSKLHRNGLR